jgi:hypothetical protein
VACVASLGVGRGHKNLATLSEMLLRISQSTATPTSWRRDPFSRTSEIDELICGLSELGELGPKASWQEDRLGQNLCEIKSDL